MKKLMTVILLVLSVNSFANCERYDDYVDFTSEVIAKVLNCGNYRGLRSDVDKFGHDLGLCNDLYIEGFVCFAVGKTGVSLVKKQIPRKWLCRPDIAMKGLEIILTKTCENLTGL